MSQALTLALYFRTAGKLENFPGFRADISITAWMTAVCLVLLYCLSGPSLLQKQLIMPSITRTGHLCLAILF